MPKFAETYDVIVLGAGAGGMTAAAVAAAEGLRVLLIEKSGLVGGTTAYSGGMAWIPANSKMGLAGQADTPDTARTYLDRTVPDAFGLPLRETLIARGDEAIRYLEAHTALAMKPVVTYPDYYPDAEGATTGGRVLEPEPFDGRRLGRHFDSLRWPLPEFMLFRGMMLDRADIPHFRRAARSPASAARAARLVARYARERLTHRRGTSLHLGNAMVARLLQSVLELNVDLALNTKVTALVAENGRATGAIVADSTGDRRIAAERGIVLATGGFAFGWDMRADYLPPAAKSSTACPSNTGDGIRFGLELGGRMRRDNLNNAYWAPASRLGGDGTPARYFPHTVTDRGKPGVIAVNQAGRRFTNEAVSYHEFVLAMYRAGRDSPAIPCYLICDSAFMWKYGLGAVKPFTLSLKSQLASGYLRRGEDLEALARGLGLPPSALAETVTRYNAGAAKGEDPEFGRGRDAYQRWLGDGDHAPNPCVAPIRKPPFYAVTLYPGDLGTAAGLVTNEDAQVLDAEGAPIAGLYACGNDMNSIMNGAYPGPGITIGPALTFGYIAARHLAA